MGSLKAEDEEMTQPRNAPAYEDDFVAWLEDQAQRARRGDTESPDLETSPRGSKAGVTISRVSPRRPM